MLPGPMRADHGDQVRRGLVAVDPARQGEGIGRALLAHAKMSENRAFYSHLGYLETGRRDEEGFDRVFFVKSLD